MRKLMRSILFTATTLCAVIMLFSSSAEAETTQCTPITTIPTIITTQGVYCLTGNLAGKLDSGNAIEITTNNVTIDFNGYKLGNLAAGPGTSATGVNAVDRKNITLRNGTIRGFYHGIRLFASGTSTASGHVVEDMRMDGNTYLGMKVYGNGAIVRNNQVVNTGGSTVNSGAFAIYVIGAMGATIVNNNISNTFSNGSGLVYALTVDINSQGSIVKNNRIINTSSGSGNIFPVYMNSAPVMMEENYISGTTSTGTRYGVYAMGYNNTIANNRITDTDTGIFCLDTSTRIRDNLSNNVTTGYIGCSSQGNNQ